MLIYFNFRNCKFGICQNRGKSNCETWQFSHKNGQDPEFKGLTLNFFRPHPVKKITLACNANISRLGVHGSSISNTKPAHVATVAAFFEAKIWVKVLYHFKVKKIAAHANYISKLLTCKVQIGLISFC